MLLKQLLLVKYANSVALKKHNKSVRAKRRVIEYKSTAGEAFAGE